MSTHAEKSPETLGRSTENTKTKRQNKPDNAFDVTENHPGTIAQRRLQEMADNSFLGSQHQAIQEMAHNSSLGLGHQTIQEMANNSPQAQQMIQLQAMADNFSSQQQNFLPGSANTTGLPDKLKSGVESLSGYSLDDVKVHYNSDKPAQLQAHAYAQGSDIHLAAGQEEHLPHEAWHVVQQKQGRVKPTLQAKNDVKINDDASLEQEADIMGAKALQLKQAPAATKYSHLQSAVSIVQAKRYTVSRNIPLETHYSLIEEDNGQKSSGKDDKSAKEKAQDVLISKLREEHPLSPEDEALAGQHNWSGNDRDQRRGDVFNRKKTEIMEQLDLRELQLKVFEYEDKQVNQQLGDKATPTGFWVPGAHVKGLSVVKERERKNTPESGLIKRVTKINDWIGAHLIKREWGGEDNMWNVVCWPKSAEDNWGKRFEEPIDTAFANRTKKELQINVNVEKEDEFFTNEDLQTIITEKTNGKNIDEDWNKVIQQDASLVQIEANRAIESVPVSASGSSESGTAELNSGDTKWEDAKAAAKNKIVSTVDTSSKRKPHPKKLENFREEAVEEKKSGYSNEREEALEQERKNYRPERYDLDHNV